MTRQVRTSILFFLLVILASLASLAQASDVVHVQTGSSIQAAIDRAQPGAIIELPQGTWQGNLRIDKSLTLRGTKALESIITGGDSGHPVIWIAPGAEQTVSVRLDSVTISAASADCADAEHGLCPDGILAQGSATVTVSRAIFTDNYAGIRLRSSAQATVSSSTLMRNRYGIIVAEQARAKIRHCTISDNTEDGLLIADHAQVELVANNIVGNRRTGISIDVAPCYATTRTFSGLIIGNDNMISSSTSDHGNAIPVCPPTLSILTTDGGGIFPERAAEGMLARLVPPPPMEGKESAPVTIIEFSDFTCPYCNRFATDTLPQIEATYIDTGKAKLYSLPFPVHGETAHLAAEAGLCAQEQGLFWNFQRILIAQYRVRGSSILTPERLAAIAVAAGADRDRFLRSLTSGKYVAAVDAAVALGKNLGVNGTPTFFIDGNRMFGAASYRYFAQMLDVELNRR